MTNILYLVFVYPTLTILEKTKVLFLQGEMFFKFIKSKPKREKTNDFEFKNLIKIGKGIQ